jgi:hypothetical protein
MWWSLGLELLLIGILVFWAISYLVAKKTPFHVYVTVWVSWTSALALVALVPLDLNLVYVRRCISHYGNRTDAHLRMCDLQYWRSWSSIDPSLGDKQMLKVSEEALRTSWLFVYTVCQLNGWILLTFQQSYIETRHFSRIVKLHQAFLDNMGFYATCAVVGALLVVIIALSGNDLEYVLYGLMACSNAICLVIVTILFGYGLAEYPRSLWKVKKVAASFRVDDGLHLSRSNSCDVS